MKRFDKAISPPVCIFLVFACCLLPRFSAVEASASGAYPAHLRIALGFENHRETAYNRSPYIDQWNRSAGVPPGSYYCASFVSWCLKEARVRFPKKNTASSRAFIVPGRSYTTQQILLGVYRPKAGDILVWVRQGGGHIGFVIGWDKATGTTIEANTSSGKGSQANGDGVYRRTRRIEPFSAFRITHFTVVEE